VVDSLHLYFRYLGASVRSQMQYRGSFILLSIAHLFATGADFVGLWVLFHRFGSLRGWSLAEVALIYGMVSSAFAFADATSRGFDMFGETMVRTGDFDRILLRPRSLALQIAGQELTLRRVGRLSQSVPVLLWAAWSLHVAWSPAKVALVVMTIVGGACLFNGLFVLRGTLAFWTVESLEIMNTVTYGGVEASEYPLTIYPAWFRRFFTFVIPLACISYFPALTILERTHRAGVPAFLPWAAPLAGLLFLVMALQVWNTGVRHYQSTGS
jgi:ABC-2 type transport system permease protein